MSKDMFHTPTPEEINRMMMEARQLQYRAMGDLIRNAGRLIRRSALAAGRALVGWAAVIERSRRAQQMYDELSHMTDRQLAARGLTRQDIPQAVSAAVFEDADTAQPVEPARETMGHAPMSRPQPARSLPREEIREAA